MPARRLVRLRRGDENPGFGEDLGRAFAVEVLRLRRLTFARLAAAAASSPPAATSALSAAFFIGSRGAARFLQILAGYDALFLVRGLFREFGRDRIGCRPMRNRRRPR